MTTDTNLAREVAEAYELESNGGRILRMLYDAMVSGGDDSWVPGVRLEDCIGIEPGPLVSDLAANVSSYVGDLRSKGWDIEGGPRDPRVLAYRYRLVGYRRKDCRLAALAKLKASEGARPRGH